MRSPRCMIAAAAAAAVVMPAGPAAAVTCRSGFEIFVRYELQIRGVTDRNGDGAIYGCTRSRRRPARLHHLEQSVTIDTWVYGRYRDRLAIGFFAFADGGGGWSTGWWNLRTGQAVVSYVAQGRLDWGPTVRQVAVGPGGEIALAVERANEDGDHAGWDLVHKPFADGRFQREWRQRDLGLAELDPETLTVDGATLNWRTLGALRSASAPKPSGASGRRARPAPRSVGCGSGQPLYGDGDADIFIVRRPEARRGTYACRFKRGARPVRIARAPVLLRLLARRGNRIAFHVPASAGVPGGALGWFHTETGRASVAPLAPRPDGSPHDVSALALDPRAGSIAYVADDPQTAGGLLVGYLPSGRSGLEPASVLARIGPPEIERHTLATEGGEVTWRQRGEPRTATAVRSP